MKAFITIITIILVLLSSNKVQAQDLTETKSLLKNKTWVMNESLKLTMRVTDTEIIYFTNGKFLSSEKYHLSDKNCIDASFDPTKVGLVSKGNYILYEKSSCSYILFANPSEFKMGSKTGGTGSPTWITVLAQP